MTCRMGRSLHSAGDARPIGPYERLPATVEPWDPRAIEVAAAVAELVHERRPDLVVEHIGSTAVPGLPGKGIVDLAIATTPDDVPGVVADAPRARLRAAARARIRGRRRRPMLVGSLVRDGDHVPHPLPRPARHRGAAPRPGLPRRPARRPGAASRDYAALKPRSSRAASSRATSTPTRSRPGSPTSIAGSACERPPDRPAGDDRHPGRRPARADARPWRRARWATGSRSSTPTRPARRRPSPTA